MVALPVPEWRLQGMRFPAAVLIEEADRPVAPARRAGERQPERRGHRAHGQFVLTERDVPAVRTEQQPFRRQPRFGAGGGEFRAVVEEEQRRGGNRFTFASRKESDVADPHLAAAGVFFEADRESGETERPVDFFVDDFGVAPTAALQALPERKAQDVAAFGENRRGGRELENFALRIAQPEADAVQRLRVVEAEFKQYLAFPAIPQRNLLFAVRLAEGEDGLVEFEPHSARRVGGEFLGALLRVDEIDGFEVEGDGGFPAREKRSRQQEPDNSDQPGHSAFFLICR